MKTCLQAAIKAVCRTFSLAPVLSASLLYPWASGPWKFTARPKRRRTAQQRREFFSRSCSLVGHTVSQVEAKGPLHEWRRALPVDAALLRVLGRASVASNASNSAFSTALLAWNCHPWAHSPRQLSFRSGCDGRSPLYKSCHVGLASQPASSQHLPASTAAWMQKDTPSP